MRNVNFGDVPNSEWDIYVNMIPESTYLHSSWWISYLNAINGSSHSKSFILMDGNLPIAVCPVATYEVGNLGNKYIEATFKGFPSIYPAILDLPATQRRRTARKIFSLVEERLSACTVKRIEFYRHPMNLDVLKNGHDNSNVAEALSHGYICHIKNMIIMDLRKKEDELLKGMSQYQRKHIRRSQRQGLDIKEYRGNNVDIDRVFDDFQSAHFKSAGRLTRPIESWAIMRALLKDGKATLFTANIKDMDISYLYCGEFDKFSFGWSQVNLDEYEKEYAPRHLLEWAAMMSYEKRDFYYYEVGAKLDSPQLNYIPTEKERSISQLKERYGGRLYPCLYFEKFFDKGLFLTIYKKRLEDFVNASSFSVK